MATDVITLIIVGEHTCLICQRTITQADVNQGTIFGFGGEDNMLFACLSHFFDDAAADITTADYKTNLHLVAQAVAKQFQQ